MGKLSKKVSEKDMDHQDFIDANYMLQSLNEMFRDILQEILEAEMDEYLGYTKYDYTEKAIDNSRNGYSKKTLKTELGPVEVKIPRDRIGNFKPKIISKYQRSVEGIEAKILALYAMGMITSEMSKQIKKIYDMEISEGTVSNIRNRILPLVSEREIKSC